MFRASYQEIALRIQADIRKELDITVSAGLSLSKSLAKLASKFRKSAFLNGETRRRRLAFPRLFVEV